MATFPGSLLDALAATDVDEISLGAVRVRHLELALPPWRGATIDSLVDDCRKGPALVRGSDGAISCIEVEVGRRLRAVPGWDAGWVQGFPCGQARWSTWIWATLPPVVDAINCRIQAALGARPTSRSGHPDVAVTDGRNVLYVECKVDDEPTATQVRWLAAAVERGLVQPSDYLIVRLAPTSERAQLRPRGS